MDTERGLSLKIFSKKNQKRFSFVSFVSRLSKKRHRPPAREREREKEKEKESGTKSSSLRLIVFLKESFNNT